MTTRSHLFWIALGCSACWGEGPTPTSPSGVDIVFYVPPTEQTCSGRPEPYISDVAIEDGYLYAALFKWFPPNDCDGPNGPTGEQYDVGIHRVPLTPEGVGGEYVAGTTSDNTQVNARVAAGSNRGFWVYSSSTSMELILDGEPTLDSPPGVDKKITYGNLGTKYFPSGFVADDDYGYLVATNTPSQADFNNPAYPSGGTSGTTPPLASLGWRIRWLDGAVAALPLANDIEGIYTATVKTGLVANSTTLFYASRKTTDLPVELVKMSKAAVPPEQGEAIAAIDTAQGTLVGFAADNTKLIWTISSSYRSRSDTDPLCIIGMLDLTDSAAKPTRIFASTNFSCLDVEIDDTHAYFTIVTVVDDSRDNTGSALYGMRGIGFGRIAFDNPALAETLRHGINTRASGPRRIYLDDADRDVMYAVDPFAIGRIAKSVLAGKHDFDP